MYPVEVAGLVGFSQGGIVGIAATLERPGLYGRVAGLHSYLPASHDPRENTFKGIAGTPLFLAAGAVDEIVPAERVEATTAALRAVDLDVTAERVPGGHRVSRVEREAPVDWLDGRP